MSYFFYTTLDDDGRNKRHTEFFVNEDVFLEDLANRHIDPVSYFKIPDIITPLIDLARPKLTAEELIELCNYLSMYVGSGLDVQSALGDLAAASKRPAFKKAMLDLQGYLLDGFMISQAMEKTGVIPSAISTLASIGEESGSLEGTLKDAAEHIERVESIKSTTKRAMIYPAFTLVAMLGGFIFWTAFVVPKIVDLFYTMGVELPTATVLLINISEFMAAYWLYCVLVIVSIPSCFTLARRLPKFRYLTDRFLWKMPIFGQIVRGSQLAFYFQYMALMYSAGIPITTALITINKSLSNSYFQSRVSDIADSLKSGESLLDAFGANDTFDTLVNRMMGIGEQTGSLDKQLTRLANIYFERVHLLVDSISKLIEPLIMAIVAVMFAFFAIALLGPLYELMTNMRA
ncbi:MAG: type II secretion system F family protein [Gammaproteobacteria bacterium]|nr:type II secretion system F family protein [Gammaproteobacteria bacterium]